MFDTADTNHDTNIEPKSSKDKIVNDYGRSLLTLCKATGYGIMNRRLYNDTNIGDHTYQSELGKSVIDLLICKPSSIQMIKKVQYSASMTCLDSILLSLADSNTCSDDICKYLYNYIESAIDGYFQKKSSKNITQFPNNPWFDCECKWQKSLVNNYGKINNIHVEPYKTHFRELKTK